MTCQPALIGAAGTYPLQRFAEKVASAAMPNTRNTPEYAAHRKMQVYETAVAEAYREGGISHKERVLLNHLRDSLGITGADAEALEHELLGAGKQSSEPADRIATPRWEEHADS